MRDPLSNSLCRLRERERRLPALRPRR